MGNAGDGAALRASFSGASRVSSEALGRAYRDNSGKVAGSRADRQLKVGGQGRNRTTDTRDFSPHAVAGLCDAIRK
jgi:hypothetical protein